ncbi:MAG: hypothetical protein C0608_05020 [Deltaproteobacteria bacterium]|nr:MAG: hypothetical protein C0608_05020 [Deltaproteobacteria bacterium]
MAIRKLLPGVDIVIDGDEISFRCDGETIEDMEFTWDDFEDPVLLGEVSEELAEYVDEEESSVDNPAASIKRLLKKLVRDNISDGEEEDFDPEDDDDDDDDDDSEVDDGDDDDAEDYDY